MEFSGMPSKSCLYYSEFYDIFEVMKCGFKTPELSPKQLEDIEDEDKVFDKESISFCSI